MLGRLTVAIFGERPTGTIPERTRAAIRDQQIESEILIGWVQFALVAFFAILYAVAPKTAMNADFQPVPFALALYFAFTVVRLGLAYRRTIPGWFLIASVVMDMTLLMGLIWSFHIQYLQPAPFYLKAPTMLYVFIFIALRALRFEPQYVLAAGVAAALGWLVLLVYAITDMGSISGTVTRDYVRYLTDNVVLIGAEIDKILSILMVTGVLAVALVRAERLLARAVVEGAAARELKRFVAPEVAARITSAERAIEAGDGETKRASVLFTDIEGFSSIAERIRPEELMKALNEYFGTMSAAIDRHGGTITQYAGDAMLVSFNTLHADPDHAANAVRTALAIQEAVRERTFGAGIAMRTRCGINTGELVAGAVGSGNRLLFTVHGDQVNVAARLEQLNKHYGTYVLASEETVAGAGGVCGWRPVGEVTVRGRHQPTRVFTPET